MEYVLNIPQHVKKILLQARAFKELQIAFREGESGTNYFTVKSGCTYYEDNVQGPFKMAIQSLDDDTVIEYVTWSHWD